jgi:hypothetical protein
VNGSIGICTSVYPIADAFLEDYVDGLSQAVAGHKETTLILAVENGYNPSRLISALPASVIAIVQESVSGSTPAGLRGVMLAAAVRSKCDYLVFADFDDRLRPGAIERHLQALQGADISYGDLAIIDAESRDLGRTFFDGACVPEKIHTVTPVLHRNFLGFSNTAVRRVSITGAVPKIPDEISAADWWVYTHLLQAGLTGRRADGVVSDYRVYANSLLGANAAGSRHDLIERCRLALIHYRHLSPLAAPYRDDVENLAAALESTPDWAAKMIVTLQNSPGVWFDDVKRAVDIMLRTTDRTLESAP